MLREVEFHIFTTVLRLELFFFNKFNVSISVDSSFFSERSFTVSYIYIFS